KNFSENISTASEIQDTFQMLLRHKFGAEQADGMAANMEALQKRSEDVRALLAHNLIVGFGSGRQAPDYINSYVEGEKPSPVIRATKFGWIIAPRVLPGGERQVDGQYSLTAVVSVPSWWRTAEIEIEKCWISRENLRDLLRSDYDGVLPCTAND